MQNNAAGVKGKGKRYQKRVWNNIFITCIIHPNQNRSYMKALQNILILGMLVTPALSYSQSQDASKKTSSRKVTVMDTSKRVNLSKDPVIKENAPVLDDKGEVNTTGTGMADGSRSSTGRPDAGYTVRKRKRTIKTGGVVYPDTATKKP